MKYIVALAMLFVAAGCVKKDEQTISDHDKIPVSIVTLSQEEIKGSIQTAGYFTTDDETYQSFKIGGVIKAVFVNDGDRVSKGQVLAILEKTEIDAQVATANAAYEKAKRDMERVSALYRDSVATLMQLQDAKTGFEMAKQQLHIAQYNGNYAEIRADKDGTVLKKLLNAGQIVGAGTPVLITNGAAPGKWLLRVGVSDAEWSNISIGDKAEVKTDLGDGVVFAGAVIRKSEAIDQVSGTFQVDIKPANLPHEKVASGMFGKANINLKKSLKAWKIPYESLLDGTQSSGFVFTTNDKQTVQKTEVRLGNLTENGIIVLGGLEDRLFIVTSGGAYLKDGSRISLKGMR